jgi:hypothetical protein
MFRSAPQRAALVQCKQPAPAWRTNILIMEFAFWRLKPEIETDLIEHFLKVLNMHL